MMTVTLIMEFLRKQGTIEALRLALHISQYLFMPFYGIAIVILLLKTWSLWRGMLVDDVFPFSAISQAIEFIVYAFFGNPVGIIIMGLDPLQWQTAIFIQTSVAFALYTANCVAAIVMKKKLR